MNKSTTEKSWFEWFRIILCGLILGCFLGYSFHVIKAWTQGQPINLPINCYLYIMLYCLFHLVEFFLTAIYRPNDLCFHSFLVNQSGHYILCTVIGIAEFWIEYQFLGRSKSPCKFMWIGFSMALGGFILRAAAEIQMEGNFTHQIRLERDPSHELITTGIYSICRHPSYTGWFYFLVGRELLLLNPISFIFSFISTWLFMCIRISYEEKYLISFFSAYEEYRKHTFTFIPFLCSIPLDEFHPVFKSQSPVC